MVTKFTYPLLVVVGLILSACGLTIPTISPIATNTVGIATVPATSTLPAASASPNPTGTAASTVIAPAASATSPAGNIPVTATNPGSSNYIDDRSTPTQVIVSYYNAVNRQEYSRAYGYWSTPSTSLGNFTSFANGYANTKSVDLAFGQITSDAGMSQVYYTVPVILNATDKNNIHTNYAACYIIHQSSPGVFGAPPFQPMSIDRGSAKNVTPGSTQTAALATACDGFPVGPNPISTSGSGLNIDKNNFVDNRSGPIETVSSLLYAINLKQYVRAYYYFQDPVTFPGSYDPYAAGFSNTDTITATFGTVQSEGAAGSLYYKVPLAEKVLTTSNTTQTFVGCYTLRLSQPANQTVPPFQPLGITTGKFTQVDNSADLNSLLSTSCN